MTPDTAPPGTKYEKRDIHLVRYWQRHGFIRNGYRVLDCGSGTGHILRAIKRVMNVDITCVEPGESYHDGLKVLGCRVTTHLDEVTADEQFDAAIAVEVIEHVTDPLDVLQKMTE